MGKLLAWKITKIISILLAIFSFSPLVLSPNDYNPYILGMPYSLGLGIVISLAFILLVVIGAIVAPKVEDTKER